MFELLKAIPDVDVLLALEPEELAARMLFLIRKRPDAGMFNLGNLRGEIWTQNIGQQTTYPRQREDEIDLAIGEALAWLESQGLIIPAQGMNGSNGWRLMSRRARRFQDESEVANFTAARRLPKDALHPRIRNTVWAAFMRGEFDVAALQATKAVEVAVREAAGLEKSDIGVKLMRKAFDVDSGALTDLDAERSERQALSDLFAGVIGTFKNPQSHRDVDLADPAEAAEIVMTANLLLRIVDARASARSPS